MKWASASLLIVAVTLSACSADRERRLTNFRNTGNGPDEFNVVPTKPLQTPENLNELPAPTPGAPNRADQTPLADAIFALGGKPSSGTAIPASDAAIVNYASRSGVEAGIRQTLTQEDYELRRRYGRRDLFRLGKIDDYTAAYKPQWLNADAEQYRLRQFGVKTPSAPPPE